ncbi:MAG TPA: aminotransferase class V-fold PLP-dependent enzyme [Clostridiaceae bacterium]|nr:aminotransferase class V-fold PLP-dependent enzyme [Clostridiaceae bacterium]
MIYLDSASTSALKPKEVSTAVYNALVNVTGSPGRGSGSHSLAASRVILDARNEICRLFNFMQSDNVIFKSSVTESLNSLMLGLLKEGDHVISSVMEHNSVLRPLEQLRLRGVITYDLLGADAYGRIRLDDIGSLEKDNTRLVILAHASNLTGTVQPIGEVRSHLRNKDIFIISDIAQSAGYIPVDFQDLGVDAVAFAGHKGLLGPQGTGGFVLNDRLDHEIRPVFTGGTGSSSSSLNQPDFLPDKYEAGTMNTPGISGLLEGIRYLGNVGIDSIQKTNYGLMDHFLRNLRNFEAITLHGLPAPEGRVPNFSLTFKEVSPSSAAFILENRFGIITRPGLHCAPLAHKAMGTAEEGSLRISFSHFNTKDELDILFHALGQLKGDLNGN